MSYPARVVINLVAYHEQLAILGYTPSNELCAELSLLVACGLLKGSLCDLASRQLDGANISVNEDPAETSLKLYVQQGLLYEFLKKHNFILRLTAESSYFGKKKSKPEPVELDPTALSKKMFFAAFNRFFR